MLKQCIEQARHKLNKLEKQLYLGHPAVLHQSMVLDELINAYNRHYFKEAMGSLHSSNPAREELWAPHSMRLSFS
ncbi:Spo0E like sporulation regulatory protein [compost metagenome]